MRSAILVALLLAAWAVQADAQQGLLFRVQPPSPETAGSWLFATIHSDDPRVTSLPKPVTEAVDASAGLVLEVVPDAKMAEVSRAAMMLGSDQRLSELLPGALYRETQTALGARGMSSEMVDRLQPWAALMLLSTPPSRGEPVLDLVLYQRALASGKPVQGLESIDEQLAVFGELSLPDQIALLSQAVEERHELPRIFGALVGAYLARDLDQLMHLGRTLVSNDPAVDARLRAALIEERNARMFERILPLLRKGNQFVAVGALHLPGDAGLLTRLGAQGIEVTRVY